MLDGQDPWARNQRRGTRQTEAGCRSTEKTGARVHLQTVISAGSHATPDHHGLLPLHSLLPLPVRVPFASCLPSGLYLLAGCMCRSTRYILLYSTDEISWLTFRVLFLLLQCSRKVCWSKINTDCIFISLYFHSWVLITSCITSTMLPLCLPFTFFFPSVCF